MGNTDGRLLKSRSKTPIKLGVRLILVAPHLGIKPDCDRSGQKFSGEQIVAIECVRGVPR